MNDWGWFRVRRERRTDSRMFGVLFGLMCLWIVGLALAEVLDAPPSLMSAGFAILCVQALLITARSLRERVLFVALGTYLFIQPLFTFPNVVEAVSAVVLGVFLIFIPIRLSVYVLEQEEVDSHTVFGALCAYLFLGLSFAALYEVITRMSPMAIYTPEERAPDFVTWVYFSFTTLTTLGYGDIAPRSYPARMLAIFEALIGQIYLVVVVARLVASAMSSRVRKS